MPFAQGRAQNTMLFSAIAPISRRTKAEYLLTVRYDFSHINPVQRRAAHSANRAQTFARLNPLNHGLFLRP